MSVLPGAVQPTAREDGTVPASACGLKTHRAKLLAENRELLDVLEEIRHMVEDMAQLNMTEAELARDLHAVLQKVQQGAEIIVERDAQPMAIIKSPRFRGRSIDECIALAKARGSHAILDDEFAEDLEDVINSHREPLNPTEWD